MTFADLQSTVSYWLDDLQFGYFTPTQVQLWINNAQKEVQKKILKAGQNYYKEGVQTQLVVNQRDYVLPMDFKKINRLEVLVSGIPPNENVIPVIPITTNQVDLIEIGVGIPKYYDFKRNRLVLYPAPDAIYTLRMQYSYLVQDMVNPTDIPDVPVSYHEFIALLAAQDGFIKDGRASDLLNMKIQKYEKDLLEDSQERNVDVPRGIVQTTSDNAGYYF